MTFIEATLCRKEAEDKRTAIVLGTMGPCPFTLIFLLFLFLLEYPAGTSAEEKDIPLILTDTYLMSQ